MRVALKNVRLAFPKLWKAEQVMGQGDPKFSATFLFAPNSEAHLAIEAAIKAISAEKWKDKGEAVVKSIRANPMKFCLKDGDTKAQFAGYAGNLFLSASSKTRVTVVDSNKTPLTSEDGKPYPGCYVNAFIDIWADDRQYGKGIFATLGPIQFHRDGEAFSGGLIADADDFEDVSEGALAEEFA